MVKILVTGGYGFIGSHFIKYILKNYKSYDIINFDNLSYAHNKNNLKEIEQNPRYGFVKGDICDKEALNKIIKNVDYVVNFAAQSHVDRSFNQQELFYSTNTMGVINILDAVKNSNVKKFLQISTDEVYGENMSNTANDENSPLRPTNPYSASKAAADLFCLSSFKSFDTPVVISRSSNNFGINQHREKFIPNAILHLLEKRKVPIYGDGTQKRDWLWVEDNVKALDLILHKGKTGNIYNICADNILKNIELADILAKMTGAKGEYIEFVKDRISHDRRYFITCKKIKDELGFKINNDFYKNLSEVAEYYKNSYIVKQ